MHYQLDGKVAVVTAAAQGIGRAAARIMAESGAAVVLADLNADKVRKTAADICAAGGKAGALVMDARDEQSVRAVIAYAHETYGRLDILHNNAGGSYPDRDRQAAEATRDVWEEVFAWNMHSAHWACQAAIPLMIAGGGGSIINTVTAGAFFAQSTLTAYGTAKGALASYTRYVAVQYGRQNIRCNGIAPGLIVRPLATRAMPDSVRAAIGKHTTTPRLGQPDDIGHMAAFLASDAAGYINGQIMLVDGGVSARFPHDAEMREIMAGGGY
jgi:NAD(P)-dependent dehydrogenase (short-subunit alcohol dehydrogenase family)